MRTTSPLGIIPTAWRILGVAATFAVLTLGSDPASAQDDTYAYSSGSSSRSSSSKAAGLFVGAESLLLASTLGAGSPGAAIAVGYDATQWRAEGLIGLLFRDGAGTNFGFGGRAFYALHKTDFADFSVGGLLGLLVGGGAIFLIEPSAQIRAFIVRNVALTATLGLGIAVGDTRATIGLLGQVTGGLGVTYTFD